MSRVHLTSRKIYAYLSAAWVDITADVLAPSTPSAKWGMTDNGPLSLLADVGTMNFILNNPTGEYTPGHPNALADWELGAKVKMVMSYAGSDWVRYYGTIGGLDIHVEPAENAGTATVTVVDWMAYAIDHPMVSPTYQTNITANNAINTVVLGMPVQPVNNTYITGIYTFPATGDSATVKTRAYTEFAKICFSEFCRAYLKHDFTGENLYLESNHSRNGLRTLTLVAGSPAVLENTMMSADIRHGKKICNRAIARVYPKRIDTSLSVLFSLSSPMLIGPGETKTFRGGYTDPTGGAQVNAISGTMVAPVASTDYEMFENSDGTGTDMTADLTVTPIYGSEGVTYTLTNAAATRGYITLLQARGYGIYQYNSIEASDESIASQNARGYKNLSFDQQYQRDTWPGKLEVKKIVELDKKPRTELFSITASANRSNEMMLMFLNIEVGDLVNIIIDQAGIDGWFYIQGISFLVRPGGKIMFTWIVRQAFSLLAGLSLLGVTFAEANTVDVIDFSYLPHVSNLTTRTDSVWIRVNSWPAADQSISQIGESFRLGLNSTNHSIVYYRKQATTDGEWETPVDSIALDTWYHILATRDESTVTNDPIIYIAGSAQTLTETSTPAGAVQDQTGAPLTLGNVAGNATPFDGTITDYRVYLPIVSAGNAAVICGEGPGGVGHTTGLAFQAPTVRTSDLSIYEGQTLTAEEKILDNMYGIVGTPGGDLVAENLRVVLGNVEIATGTGATPLVWNHRVKPGNNRIVLIAVLAKQGDSTVTAPYYEGGQFDQSGMSQVDSGTGSAIQFWYVLAPPVGVMEITYPLAAAADFAVVSMDFSNVDQTAPFGGAGYVADGTSATASVTATGSAFGDMVVDIVAALSTLTVGAKQTACLNQNYSSIRGGVSFEPATGANTVMSWALGASNAWSIGAVAVKVAP